MKIMINKSLHVKLDSNRFEELRYIAYKQATTMGKLVREAIDIYLREKRYKGGENETSK